MKRPQLVGILNITPDSFSGDGVLAEAALMQALALIEAGADMLDIGAESTRPGAVALSHAEEWARLAPVLRALHEANPGVRVSVDTYHAATASKALALFAPPPIGGRVGGGLPQSRISPDRLTGESAPLLTSPRWGEGLMINDVGGLRDAAMCRALSDSACDIVVMHALTVPADASVVWPLEIQPVHEILRWKNEVITRAATFGIAAERLIFDPGIGFGKTAEQSLALMQGAAELQASGGRWLYGHSRKSFMTLLSDGPAADRDALTLAFSARLAEAGIDYLRVHNVKAHQALFAHLCT